MHCSTLFLTPAVLEAGVIGDQSVKRVLTLSKEGNRLRSLEERWTGPGYRGFFLTQKEGQMDGRLSGYSYRMAGWVEETSFYQLISEEENPTQLTTRMSFEEGLCSYRNGDYQTAYEIFDTICRQDSQDLLAAYYRMESYKGLGGSVNEKEGRTTAAPMDDHHGDSVGRSGSSLVGTGQTVSLDEYLLQINRLTKTGDHQQALSLCDQAVQDYPQEGVLYEKKAQIYWSDDQADLAIRNLGLWL